MATNKYTAAFCAVVELAEALGVSKINEFPGCWELQVDDQWFIALNGHDKPTACSRNPTGFEGVAPFCCYVEFNGWPAGVVSPSDGVFAAGSAANEQTFIEAMKRRAAHHAPPVTLPVDADDAADGGADTDLEDAKP